MYIVSIFIAVINTLLNNHEFSFDWVANFFTSSYFLEKIFQLQVGPNQYNGCIYGLIIMTWKTGQ